MPSSGNFCVWDDATKNTLSGTVSDGNLEIQGNSNAAGQRANSTFGLTSGKWYMEFRIKQAGNNYPRIGLSLASAFDNAPFHVDENSGFEAAFLYEAGTENNGSNCKNGNDSTGRGQFGTVTYSNTGVTGATTNQIIGFALDLDNRKLFISKDGTFFNSANPATGTNAQISWDATPPQFIHLWGDAYQTATNLVANWGQDSTFSGTETGTTNADENGHGTFHSTVPTGFLAMCSANLPIDNDIDPAQTENNSPIKQHNCITWTGTGSTNAITGLGFQPDLVIVKNRDGTQGTKLTDSSRGVTKVLQAPTSSAESTDSGGVTAFGTDGFTVGDDAGYNGSTNDMVAWCWRANGGTTSTNTDGTITSTVQANQAAGFSIVQFTGVSTNTTATVGHGLGKAPTFIIHKRLDGSAWHFVRGVPGMTNASTVRDFNPNGSPTDISGSGGALSAPTTTTFDINNYTGVGGGGSTYVAYCWAPIAGYSAFGVYKGNGNANGPFMYTGFRPRTMLTFGQAYGRENFIWDTARSTFNPVNDYLRGGRSNAEGADSTTVAIDFLANGFKIRGNNADYNESDTVMIWAAWGDVPYKYNNAL